MELKDEICQGICLGRDLLKDLEILGHSQDVCKQFGTQFNRSGRRSVDRFLEGRPEFLDIGKASIASVLSKYEELNALFPLQGKKDHWYEEMYNKVFPQIQPKPIDAGLLSIITFNYDRSLEHYLFTALKSASNAPDEKCRELVESANILHVHGKLGFLPWMSHQGRAYKPN